jgi:hypothetical protein
VPAIGSAGGMLVGLRDSTFELISWQGFNFCSMILVKNLLDNFVWRIINVYGSPYEEGKVEFVEEFHSVMDKWNGPMVVGGGGELQPI